MVVRRITMLIVLLDEPGLFVFQSLDEAVREIEPIDAAGEIRAAFDESAVPYKVEWMRPNRRHRILFGLLQSIEFGEYRFVPADPADTATLIRLLESHPDVDPPEAKADVAALLERLRTV